MKHLLKSWLRKFYAYTLFYTGAHAIVNRMMPRRLTILCGHCVDAAHLNGDLPSDMRTSPHKLRRMLGWFSKRYQMCTLSEGFDSIRDGSEGPSLLALTMDDGYRDNAEVMPALLEETGARATVFLESRALDERRLNWSHKYFWLLSKLGDREAGEALLAAATNDELKAKLGTALENDSRASYHVKRVLKYDTSPEVRDPAIDALFEAEGGDERALCERVYMDWTGAKDLLSAGVELGGHTVEHPVLATLNAEQQLSEVKRGREVVERGIGSSLRVFAYPFGRRWDYDDNSVEAVRKAGFEAAVTTHAGTNDANSDPFRLARLTFDEDTSLPLLVTEACGGFDLARRFGLDLSQ